MWTEFGGNSAQPMGQVPPAIHGRWCEDHLDGSPQGRTAAFTTPYLTGGPGGEKDWKGEMTFPLDLSKKMVKKVYDLNVPLILHCTVMRRSMLS